MNFLIFQLRAALSSWGEPAVGEYRGTAEHPSESALVGLLGAALGVRRDDEAAHAALRDGYGFAFGIQSGGSLLRDYHTAQVPGRTALKGRPHATRRDELTVPKHDLTTVLSTRDYRQGAGCLVAVQAHANARYTLDALAASLRQPSFVLYLGRKSCPPDAPLWPQIIEAASARDAFTRYLERLQIAFKELGTNGDDVLPVSRIAWGDGVDAGVVPDLSTQRKDQLIRRHGWQFRDRVEHIAFLSED